MDVHSQNECSIEKGNFSGCSYDILQTEVLLETSKEKKVPSIRKPFPFQNDLSNGQSEGVDSYQELKLDSSLSILKESDQSSGTNSPFHSAAEDVAEDRDPLLIKSPPKQSVFHQFLASARNSKSKSKSSLPKKLNPFDRSKLPPPQPQLPPDEEGELEDEDQKNGHSHPSKGKCSIGILLAAISCIFFATSALIVKISVLHPMELLCVRGLLQAVFISPIVISSGNSFLGPSGSRALLLSRAVLGSVSLVMSFASIHLIPLADAATVIFTSPVFVSLFACICLRELCSWFDVTMIFLTLVGVILVSQPSFNLGSWTSFVGIGGIICGLSAALLTALAFIVLRQLKNVHYSITVFWFSVVLAAFGAVLMIALDGFTVPGDWQSVMECVGIGICGFLGQILLTKALQIENAGPCAVARTLDIVLAFFYQITLLHDTPDWYSYLGSFLVVSCVLLTAFRRWYEENLKMRLDLNIDESIINSRGRDKQRGNGCNNKRSCNYSRAMT